MRVLTINELLRLTRITDDLPGLPEGSVERANAHVNVGTIRCLLARRDFSP